MAEGHIKRTVALETLGCKLNQAETEFLAWQLAQAGYRLVSSVAEADIYILNTCTVTHIADRKSRHLLRLAHRRNPNALVVATGCYAERAGHEIAQIAGVHLVINNKQKPQLPQLLQESGCLAHPALIQQDSNDNGRLFSNLSPRLPKPPACQSCVRRAGVRRAGLPLPLVREGGEEKRGGFAPSLNSLPAPLSKGSGIKGEGLINGLNGFRTRSFIKVQDGCHSFCSYCIVPLVRGRERSLPAEQIIAEIRQRVSEGCQEVVLTGTKVGSYSDDGVDLKGLLERILAETDVSRLRLSSLQPQEISLELIGLWRDERLCRHFHFSLQSGSDSVLERMRRRYSMAGYQQAISLIRNSVPEVAITTDIIVGFPGETDEEFEQSYNFCQQMEFARIHVFSYSARSGTEAARMPQPVGEKVKQRRSERMLALARESAQNFRQIFLGKTMTVLWEKQSNGIWSGLTDNYIKVYTRSDADLTNQLLPVKLVEVFDRGGVWGELVEE